MVTLIVQELAIINQTEIITIPWNLDGSMITLFSRRCQLIYQSDHICYQILTEDAKGIIILTNSPLALAYPLLNKVTFFGPKIFGGTNLLGQGHKMDDNLGEFKVSEVQPLIIEGHQRRFEPLKTQAVPMMETPKLTKFGIEFHLRPSKSPQHTEIRTDDDVI
ncbi:hypothetical protein TSAR_005691 [Trichomalopsis sarcophagae]|uniref:Uncharacterized protein n=1 Tax=Trichomalopsis sarcophagae TaxID=543379 RepID=A0A232FJB5_9HYME|nr:hypothetical protein TSAR_005691 [Trichomalopsis sarcophagae]